MVGSSGKDVGLLSLNSWSVADDEVVVGQKVSPASLSTIENFGGHEVFEGFVVGDDFEGFVERLEEGSPLGEGENNRKHLLVVSLVILFC